MQAVHPDLHSFAQQSPFAEGRDALSKFFEFERQACTSQSETSDSSSMMSNGLESYSSIARENIGTTKILKSNQEKAPLNPELAGKAVYHVPTLSPLESIRSNDFHFVEDLQPSNNTRIAYSDDFVDKPHSFPNSENAFVDKKNSALVKKNNDLEGKMYNAILNKRNFSVKVDEPSLVNRKRKFSTANLDSDRDAYRYKMLKSRATSGFSPFQPTRRSRRVELPMNILGSTYATCPDSGSHENIMVKGVAQQLGLDIESSTEHRKEFRIGNGKIVKSLGRTCVKCSFAKEPDLEYLCWFYVFRSLIKSVIMGMAFLDATETLTKHKNRLQCSMSPRTGPLQLCALNNPAQRLGCMAEGKRILANADTGSEIDFISLAYAKRRSFEIEKVNPQENKVQFADGSLSYLAGRVSLDIFIGQYDLLSVNRGGKRLQRTFYVLDGLTSDMLLGDEFLDETDAFNTYRAALSSDASKEAFSQLNTIVWFKTPERYFGRHLFGKSSITAPEPLDGNSLGPLTL